MMCFSQKIIVKLNNFLLAFCWWYILLMSLERFVQYFFEQRLNLTTELILSSWNHVNAYVHANLFMLCVLICFFFFYIMHFFSVFFTVCVLAKWASLHSSISFICSHLLYFAGENEKQSEFCIVTLLEHWHYWYDTHYLLLDILTEQLFILGFT